MELTPKILGDKLAERAEEFVVPLLPNGKRVGSDWAVGSIGGEAGNSLKISLTNGKWKDFANDEKGGDLLDLYAAVKGIALGKAMRECASWLGIEVTEWKSRQNRKRDYVERAPKPDNACRLSDAPAVASWLAGRRISPETLERYRVFADGNGTVVFPYIPEGGDYATHLKFRSIKEKQFWSSKNTRKTLCGWHALEPRCRAVILTEGEMDMLSMAEYGFQTLSIPYGGGGAGKQDWIEEEWDNLQRFDTIYLAVETDSAGMVAIHEIAERLGRHRCKLIKLPFKDANECLKRGVTKDQLLQLIRDARTLDPSELKNAADFTDEVIQRFHPTSKNTMGFHLPWASVMETGFVEYGALTVLAGYSGHGKTEIVSQVVLSAAQQGVRACVASLEFKASKWLQRQTRQAVRDPSPGPQTIRRALNWMGENIWAVDVYGGMKADRAVEVFEYAYKRYGVRLFVLDNLSKLGIADDDLPEQKRVINLFAEFAVRTNTHFILVHHLRKVEDDFSAGNKLSLKGSSAIGDMADDIWLVLRNRKKEAMMADPKFLALDDIKKDEIRRSPDTFLRCEKKRNGDEEPRLALYFDKTSHLWVETQGEPVPIYVPPAAA